MLKKILKTIINKLYCASKLKKDLDILKLKNLELEAKIGFSHPQNLPIIQEFREKRLIVSLTTYPERMHKLDTVIYSILSQSLLPDKILVWLSHEEYPQGMDSVPHSIKKLAAYGVDILFCENIKSYKKLIPALDLYAHDIIVTADDDIFYPHNWLNKLYVSYLEFPKYIHAHRVNKITFNKCSQMNSYSDFIPSLQHNKSEPSFLNFPTGAGGTLYPPNSLHNDVARKDIFTKLTPMADDIWFWAMAVLQGTKINVVKNNISEITDLNELEDAPRLWNTNMYKNDEQMQSVLVHYPIIQKRVLEDA